MALFKKLAWFTDLHMGKGGNSPVFNQDCRQFIEWATDRAKSWGADTCIFGGDYFDSRFSIGVLTLDAALDGMQIINNSFPNTYMLAGNHDLPYREKRDGTSLGVGRNFENIHLINKPTTLENVTLLPWLVGEEHKNLKVDGRYVFGHLEIPGFEMNAGVVMGDRPDAVQAEQLTKAEYIFSGHFHRRQHKSYGKSSLIYTGSCFPHDFGDVGDAERGIMLMEWGKDPIFEAWPDQPLYMAAQLSNLIEHPTVHLKKKMSVRCSIDIPISFEEAQEVRDTLIKTFDLRKVELSKPIENNTQMEMSSNVVFRNVDQMVIEGLMTIDSPTLSKDMLIDIYGKLAEGGE